MTVQDRSNYENSPCTQGCIFLTLWEFGFAGYNSENGEKEQRKERKDGRERK